MRSVSDWARNILVTLTIRAVGALVVAARKGASGKMIVVLIPDTDERYNATALFGTERPRKGWS